MSRSVVCLVVSLLLGLVLSAEVLGQKNQLTAYNSYHAVQMADIPATNWWIQYRTPGGGSWHDWRGGHASRQSAERALLAAVERGQFPPAMDSRIVPRQGQPNWQTIRWFESRAEAQNLINGLRRGSQYSDKLFQIIPVLIRKNRHQLQAVPNDFGIEQPDSGIHPNPGVLPSNLGKARSFGGSGGSLLGGRGR